MITIASKWHQRLRRQLRHSSSARPQTVKISLSRAVPSAHRQCPAFIVVAITRSTIHPHLTVSPDLQYIHQRMRIVVGRWDGYPRFRGTPTQTYRTRLQLVLLILLLVIQVPWLPVFQVPTQHLSLDRPAPSRMFPAQGTLRAPRHTLVLAQFHLLSPPSVDAALVLCRDINKHSQHIRIRTAHLTGGLQLTLKARPQRTLFLNSLRP